MVQPPAMTISYPIDAELGFNKARRKPITTEAYEAIKAGNVVKFRGSKREFLVMESGGAVVWGKEIVGGRAVGSSRPLYRTDIGEVQN